MINKAKNKFSESGTLYLVWGIAVLICSLAQFILGNLLGYKNAHYVWFFTWAIYIYQAIFLIRKKKNLKVKTYTGEITVVCMDLFYHLLFHHAFHTFIQQKF